MIPVIIAADLNDGEVFKGGVHLLLFGVTAMCFGHNLLVLSQRRQLHSFVNSLVYGGLILFELHHIGRHLCPPVPQTPGRTLPFVVRS